VFCPPSLGLTLETVRLHELDRAGRDAPSTIVARLLESLWRHPARLVPARAASLPQRIGGHRQRARSRLRPLPSARRAAPRALPPCDEPDHGRAEQGRPDCDGSASPTVAETLDEQRLERITAPAHRAQQCRAKDQVSSDQPSAHLQPPAREPAPEHLPKPRRSMQPTVTE
jgi:hypothetical protein